MKDSDNMEELEKLYNKTRDELLAKQMSNSETYDRSLLSLSSVFLALSVTFIKDIVPVKESLCTWLLYLSWGLFALTIIVIFLSFVYGQKGIKQLLAGAEEYYLKGNKDAYKVSEEVSKYIDWFNLASGIIFIIAIISTISFVSINSGRGKSMAKETKTVTQSEQKGQPTNTFQKPQQSGQSTGTNNQTQQTNQNTSGGNKKTSK